MTSATNPLAGCRVLLVEDDYFIADGMRSEFERLGAEVVGPVSSVDEAIELIATSDLDASVLDINLQEVMSYSVADALRARGIPFVFATGYEKAAIPERFTDVPRCEKPVEPRHISRALFG